MIGLFILALRSGTPSSLVPETFGPSRIHIPKAPGLGLLLVAPHYVEYNKRVADANAKLDELVSAGRLDDEGARDQRREAIDPRGVDGLEERVRRFKDEQVYRRMWDVEERELVFSKWVHYFDAYVGNDFGCVFPPSLSLPLCSFRVLTRSSHSYLNPKGIIPASATYQKGENPEKTRRKADSASDAAADEPQSDDEAALQQGGDDDG